MFYTVQQLAHLADVSVRTLHYYDKIGLLKPAGIKKNGYRYYEESELLTLQQILFFKELELPLEDIKRIIKSPGFDIKAALKDQRELITLKKERLSRIIKTIDQTFKKINQQTTMADKDLYGSFSKAEMEKYTKEAKKRWGNTEAYKQSQERVKKMGKTGLNKTVMESEKLTKEIARLMNEGADAKSQEVQDLIERHYNGLRAFYEPNREIYRGLADLYVTDERFKAYYEKFANGLAQFMHDAMIYFADL